MTPLRQAFDAGGNHFSFATPVTKKSHGADREGGTEYGTWIQRVKGSYDYFGSSSNLKFSARAKTIPGRYRDLSVLDGEEFMGLTRLEDDYLGDTSPPLWEKAGSPEARPTRLVPTYPSSQSQVMARYRKEMMELVRGAPEPAYELSLRDLVEAPPMAKPEERSDAEGKAVSEVVTGRAKKGQKKLTNVKKRILRSTSMDSGVFLLKMFVPTSLWGRRKPGAAGGSSRVSPKPALADGEKVRPEKDVGAEWLEGDSDMSRSGRSNGTGHGRKSMGCYPFSISKGKIRW